MAKSPHPQSLLAFACAVESYASDAENGPALPPEALLEAWAPDGDASPEMHALAREAGRQRALWDRTYAEIARQKLEAAGAPGRWLSSAGARAYLAQQCELLRASLGLDLQPAAPKRAALQRIDGKDRFRRDIVAYVIAGAYFASGGSWSGAARALNAGVPPAGAGADPFEVRNAIDTCWKNVLAPSAKAAQADGFMMAACAAAFRFDATCTIWKRHEAECLADPIAVFRTLVEDGRLLDLRRELIDSHSAERATELRRLALAGCLKVLATKLDKAA